MIRADTLGELLDVAALLSTQPVPRGRRVAVLTNAGGLGILCADACELAGLELPQLAEETRDALAAVLPSEASTANPVDMLGSATAESFRVALPAGARRPGNRRRDRAVRPARRRRAADVGAAISRAAAAANQPDKPVLAAILAANGAPATLRRAAQIPSFAYPEAAAAALGRAAELRRLAAPLGRHRAPSSTTSTQLPRQRSSPRRSRTTQKRGSTRPPRGGCCVATGCPLVEERVAATPDEAVDAPRRSSVTRSSSRRPRAGAHKTESRRRRARSRRREAVRAAARADRRAGDRAAAGRAVASSCSPASRRTPCSGRSSPSAPAA